MRIYTVLFILTVLTSCSTGKKEQENGANSSDTLTNIRPDSHSLNDQPTKTIIDFLSWYRDHQDIQGCLVSNSCNGYDSTKFYSVDFNATEKYLNELFKTGFISTVYINKRRKYFADCDKYFKANPENDGPPSGFDHDFIMLSQDTEEDLNNLNKAKVISQTNTADKATIKIAFQYGHRLVYKLALNKDRWLIDDIDSWEEK